MPSFNSLCNAKTGTTLGYCDWSQDECQPFAGDNSRLGLWCTTSGGCEVSGAFSRGAPEFTSCGTGLMCINGMCRASSFAPKTYQWSAGQWTACSASSQSRTVTCMDEAGSTVAVSVGILIAS